MQQKSATNMSRFRGFPNPNPNPKPLVPKHASVTVTGANGG